MPKNLNMGSMCICPTRPWREKSIILYSSDGTQAIDHCSSWQQKTSHMFVIVWGHKKWHLIHCRAAVLYSIDYPWMQGSVNIGVQSRKKWVTCFLPASGWQVLPCGSRFCTIWYSCVKADKDFFHPKICCGHSWSWFVLHQLLLFLVE